MNKIIFLDIDGVLNYSGCKENAPSSALGVSKEKIKLLKKIIDATGAKVVLSSTWRLDDGTKDYEYLIQRLREENVEIFGKTTDIYWSKRGLEIEGWIENEDNIDGFVVLDDIEFSDFYRNKIKDHIVIIDYNVGLTEEDVERAIEILNEDT